MDRLLVVIATVVTLVWAAVVTVAFLHRPIDPNLITLSTVVTPVMLALITGLIAVITKRMNGRRKINGSNGG